MSEQPRVNCCQLAVKNGIPLWPPPQPCDLPPVGIEIDPTYYGQYPRPVVDLIVLDVLQGHWLKRLVEDLVRDGVPRAHAKKQIYPTAPGSAFKDVVDLCRGMPTDVKMGGGGFKWTTAFEAYERHVSLIQALLGISTTNGGGPGIMMLTSAALCNAMSVVKPLGFKTLTNSELIQVLLQIGAETPNLLGKPEFRVWAIDSLKTRTPMLLSLGAVLAVTFFPGGYGTGEELLRTMVDDQLYGEIVTSLLRRVPIILLDFDASAKCRAKRKQRWVTDLKHMAMLMQRWGCIGKDTLEERTFVVNVEDPNAPEETLRILDRGAAAHDVMGFSLIEQWERENGVSLFETARKLLPQVEKLPLPPRPNGKRAL